MRVTPRRRSWAWLREEIHLRTAGCLWVDGGLFVGGVVVDDQMEGQIGRSFPIKLFEKLPPFLGRVLGGRLAENFPVQIAQCRKESDRAMPDIIVSPRPHFPGTQWQGGLGALQGLALALLIAAKHQSPLRWIQIQADHIPEFFLKFGIIGDFERAPQVGLQIVGPPKLLHRMGGDPLGLCHPS